jgi:hypothetical protein
MLEGVQDRRKDESIYSDSLRGDGCSNTILQVVNMQKIYAFLHVWTHAYIYIYIYVFIYIYIYIYMSPYMAIACGVMAI